MQQEITLGSPRKTKPQAIERLILDIQRRRVIKTSEMECGERGDTAELNRLQVSYSCIAFSEVRASCIITSQMECGERGDTAELNRLQVSYSCIALSEVRASRIALSEVRASCIKTSDMECGERGDTAELNRLQVRNIPKFPPELYFARHFHHNQILNLLKTFSSE